MNGQERRREIRELLESSAAKIRGSDLAKRFSVSRQVIVGDVALLKAEGVPVVSTPRGYILTREGEKPCGYLETLVCCHDRAHTEEELTIMVSLGALVHNVSVEHEVYGTLTGSLEIGTLEEVRDFIRAMRGGHSPLLSTLSGGIHSHLVETKDREHMEQVKEALGKAGFLYHKEEP